MKYYHYLLFLFVLTFVGANFAHAATETIKIYPTDSGINLLYDQDGFTNWSSARNFSGTLYREPVLNEFSSQKAFRPSGYYRIYRSSIRFDTSLIPDNAAIQSASLNVYKKTGDNTSDTELVITKHTRASSTKVTKPDWILTNYFDELARDSLKENQFTKIDINETGVNYLNKEGNTIIGALVDYDFDDIDPGYYDPRAVTFYSERAIGTSTDPYLEITYIVPEPESAFSELIQELTEKVEEEDLQRNQRNAYRAHLKKVERFYDSGKHEAARNQIKQFKAKVLRDLSRERLDVDFSEEVLSLAEQVLEKMEADTEESEVPLMTQIASPYPPESNEWADELYADGRADYSGSCGSTIAQCGCALSSFAMLGQSYGLTLGVDGSEATPPNIDEWLLQNDGYDAYGNIKWRQAIKYFGKARGDRIYSYLSLDSDHETDRSRLDTYLEHDKPVMTETRAMSRSGKSFTHFILSHELLANTYAINDPLWYNTENLDDIRDRMPWVQDYNDLVVSGRLFSLNDEPQKVARGFNAQIASPAEMVVTDAQGRQLGYDPELDKTYEDIPEGVYYRQNSFYSEELSDSSEDPHVTKTLDISNADPGEYTLEVIGTGDGDYYLSIHVVGENGKGELIEKWVDTEAGQRDEYTIVVSGEDADSGHGNEADKCDEDNPGKTERCEDGEDAESDDEDDGDEDDDGEGDRKKGKKEKKNWR